RGTGEGPEFDGSAMGGTGEVRQVQDVIAIADSPGVRHFAVQERGLIAAVFPDPTAETTLLAVLRPGRGEDRLLEIRHERHKPLQGFVVARPSDVNVEAAGAIDAGAILGQPAADVHDLPDAVGALENGRDEFDRLTAAIAGHAAIGLGIPASGQTADL